jgi:CRISPR-associated protein Cas2
MLNSYRIMWLITIFDLPTTTKQDKKNAAKFRNHLLNNGFEMVQFSVYMKCCSGKEQAGSISNRISKEVPAYGNVKILQITDKQFSNIINLKGKKIPRINSTQLALF